MAEYSMNKNEKKQLLAFGFCLPFICFILAWRQYAKYGLTSWVEGFIITGFIVLLMALFVPSGLKVLFEYWMKVAQVMGAVVITFVLTVVFFVVITPISVILRLMGKDFMNLRWKNQMDSYWINREDKKENYNRQF